MKIISRIFQFIAFLLVGLVVVTLPLTLAARNLGRVLFSGDALLSLANENFLNPEFLASVGQEAVQGALATPELDETEGAAINRVMLAALNNLNRGQWTRIMEVVAPQAVVSELAETTIIGFYDWLDDDDALLPEMVLDIRPWKASMAENALPLMEMVLNALPPCDAAGTQTYQREQDDLAAAASLPVCRPPEPTYSELLNVGANVLPDRLAQTPDVIDFTGQLLPEQGRNLAQVKEDLLGLRGLLRGAWVMPSFVFVVALVMGARSWRGLLAWAGWPLLLCGAVLLMAGMGLLVFSEAMLTGVFASGAMAELPRALVASIRASGAAFISLIALPTLRQAIFLGIFALVLLFVASTLKRRGLEKQLAAASTVAPAIAAPVTTFQSTAVSPPQQASTVQVPPPPLQAPAADDEGEPDDSKPTGMFG